MDVTTALYKIYWAIEKVITPGLKYSQDLYEATLVSEVNSETEWLDVGCGHHILSPWRAQQEKDLVARCGTVTGMDAEMSSLVKHRTITRTVAGNVGSLPFCDGTFNLVTANMVVEHLDDPEKQFKEIARVLKPGGMFIMHTPNRLGYSTIAAMLIPEFLKKRLVYLLQRRKEEDVFKTFYRANSRDDIQRLAKMVGLEVGNLRLIVSSAALVFVPPLVVFELLWIRMLMTKPFKPYRTNIIAILRKPRVRSIDSKAKVGTSSQQESFAG
jgi:ubiquinone/menaquinone biosynthesis C-methylase UbiE